MSAKDIIVKPITRTDADKVVTSCHYSGKVVPNSQLHFGVFLNGKCGGAMQFGPSMDKRKTMTIVQGTQWNGFLELNRMAFSEWLPRNSESRAISVAMRLIQKHYPHIDWIISFADATQCGDGTIYRASGFVLTGIKENKTILKMPDGSIVADKTLNNSNYIIKGESAGYWKKNGAVPLLGFQLRYLYFLNPEARKRLTVPIIPFTEIERRGASMYLGKPKCAGSDTKDTADSQSAKDGSIPIPALHSQRSGLEC
jgi:hypothetical protein